MPFDNLRKRLDRPIKMLPEDIEAQQLLREQQIAQLEQQDLPLQEPEIDPIGLLLTGGLSGFKPAVMNAAEGAIKKTGRQALADKLKQERLENFVKTRASMNKVVDPELAKQMDAYKKTAPTQQNTTIVKGNNQPIIDETPMTTISGQEYKNKIEKLIADKRAAKGK